MDREDFKINITVFDGNHALLDENEIYFRK
jgi:hypothetical protein